MEQLEPQSVAYNICRASRLFGNLNAPALEASLNEIISRHETLRTAFRLVDGRPVQVVQPIRNISIEYVDLRASPDDERDVEIQRRIKAESDCPFDLSAGRLLRSTLIRAGDEEHILILMTHHSASDAWSMGILTRDLWTLYEAFSNGKPSPFERLPVQYSDYAVWQRNWLQGKVLNAQLSYWKEQLKDLPILNLPTDRLRKPRQNFQGDRLAISLPEELTSAVNEISNRVAATPFMTLLAAFQVLLYRYTGQEDFAVGSPISNRRRPEIEGLIGFFVNTLVLHADLSGNPSFSKFLMRVRDVCIAADANQDLPFEKLVEELQPERDRSRNPLFQVMFVLQNATRPFGGIPDLRIEPLELETSRSPFDLSLFLREREGRYIGYIEYSTDLFDRDRIERMAGHFQTLLEALVADPDQSILLLPILTEAERHKILVEWNDTAADYPTHKCIHHLFEEQVERIPNAIALEFEEERITYREVNERANQLAHYLMTLGVGSGKLVGISVERSIKMVIGLLGILKAGGAYVPLDPSYPKERLRFMLQDAQVTVLLTQETLVEDGGWRMEDGDSRFSIFDPRLQVVHLDRDLPIIEEQSSENPTTQIESHNLAYVIYTSGSTGQPKGVAIEHRNTLAILHWAKSVFTPAEIGGVLASTSICFDLSVFELFVPLSWGGKIILVENALSLRATDAKGITLVNTVPSAMAALLAAGALPDSVRAVNLAGERLRPDLVNQLYQTGTVEKVYDLYGPSETTTYSTFVRRAANGPATIGRPLTNTRVYLLDSHMQPVPIGVMGEIYIGGAGVARGYLNLPELTAEKFVSDSFSNDATSRVYRTGDFARYLPDGKIEFLGRIDKQVKIRGYRIELGEIEAALNLHPAVKESVVVAHERQGETERELVGYVVLDETSLSDINRVRAYLATKLPAFMIPSVLVKLDDLPVTPNGKIDRSKLPSPEESPRDLNYAPIPPRSELEELVANIWRDVLQIDNISVHDNFFALGGYSLLAIQIVSRLQEAFNKEVPLRILFDNPTIAELGEELETIRRDGRSSELPPIVRAPRTEPLPLSMNQEHLWYLDQMMPGTHFFNMPYVYRLSGELIVKALERALSEIIRRHEVLRTVFKEIDGRPVQIISDGLDFQLQTIDFRGRSPDAVSQAAAESILDERSVPFDLAAGPLLSVKLLLLTQTDSLLLVTMHHIISDHGSMQVFREELVKLYEAFQQGSPSPLPEPKIQFGDYACWERRLIDSGRFRDQATYWKNQLNADRAERQIHTPTEGRYKLLYDFNRLPIDIDTTLLTQIGDVAKQQNCTLFTVITSAIFVMLYFMFGEPDIRVGTLVANRGKREAENVIGHFVNTLVLRSCVARDDTFAQVVSRVRTVSLAAYVRQQLPFEQLVRDLVPKRGTHSDSLIRALVSYRKHTFPPVSVAGLTFASCNLPVGNSDMASLPSPCDLIFDLKEMPTALTGTVNIRSSIGKQSSAWDTTSNFKNTLEILVSQPSRVVSTLSVEYGQSLILPEPMSTD